MGPYQCITMEPLGASQPPPNPLLKTVSPETLDTSLDYYIILVIFEKLNHESKDFLFPHYFSMKNSLFPREFLVD